MFQPPNGPVANIAFDFGDRGVPTINLRIDYLRMAAGTDLIARATAIKIGRSIGVVDVEVRDDDGRLIAIGRASYGVRA